MRTGRFAIGTLGLAVAAAGLAKAAVRDDEEAAPPPEPKYIGIDYGADPGRAVTLADRSRIDAAQAKRDRRAARNLRLAKADANG